ncbi:hypothetical protein [Mesorhizobium shangrilense]|uniref:Uncharacterized protein n=1 Tax=Mesorhizobium shangrilense TaxID=460060 RepID=A0ABV2D6D5_9HYPH
MSLMKFSIANTPRPDPNDEPPADAPTWTPDVRESGPDLLPDEMPTPNPDENRKPARHVEAP